MANICMFKIRVQFDWLCENNFNLDIFIDWKSENIWNFPYFLVFTFTTSKINLKIEDSKLNCCIILLVQIKLE